MCFVIGVFYVYLLLIVGLVVLFCCRLFVFALYGYLVFCVWDCAISYVLIRGWCLSCSFGIYMLWISFRSLFAVTCVLILIWLFVFGVVLFACFVCFMICLLLIVRVWLYGCVWVFLVGVAWGFVGWLLWVCVLGCNC